MKTLRAIWRWIRKWWWIVLGAVAAVGGVLFAVLVASDSDAPDEETEPKPTMRKRAEAQVERIRLEGEIEKARITATADSERRDLDRIEQLAEENPAEARRQLSTWLNGNL